MVQETFVISLIITLGPSTIISQINLQLLFESVLIIVSFQEITSFIFFNVVSTGLYIALSHDSFTQHYLYLCVLSHSEVPVSLLFIFHPWTSLPGMCLFCCWWGSSKSVLLGFLVIFKDLIYVQILSLLMVLFPLAYCAVIFQLS